MVELWLVQRYENYNANVVANCAVRRNPIRAQGTTSLLARACWLWTAPDPRRLANGFGIGYSAGENAIRIPLIWQVIETHRHKNDFKEFWKSSG